MNIQQAMFERLAIFINPETGQSLVSSWGHQPTAKDILRLGDFVEQEGKTKPDNVVFTILETLLLMSLTAENLSFDELVATAEWRQPIIEEPVFEEPVIEEPVIEEPVIEEPIIEEPLAEN